MKNIKTLKDKANKLINSPKLDNHMLEEALKYYTEAIDLKVKDKINAILYSNRAWVNLQLERNGSALEDANKSIKWDPNFIKGYYRRGCSNLALCKYEEALIDLENVYKIYPKESPLIEKIKEIKSHLENKNKNIGKSLGKETTKSDELDLRFIEEEIKKEENKIKKSESNKSENENRGDNSDTEQNKNPEYKGKLSLTKEWIVDKVIEGMKKKKNL